MLFSIFEPYKKQLFALSTERSGGVSKGLHAGLNLCSYTGDTMENISDNRIIFCRKYGIKSNNLILPRQTHNSNVLIIDKKFLLSESSQQELQLYGIDALVTTLPEICIGVATADCVPLLMFDPVQHVVAVVHAGWRGTVAYIAAKTVTMMVKNCSCNPKNILVATGPCISAKNYEVGNELYEIFKDSALPVEYIFFKNTQTGKLHLDLQKANKWQLTECGLDSKNIELNTCCTFDNSSRFFSARKYGVISGRITSCIMLKNYV